MGDSTLARTGEARPGTGQGHGTAALGPSDSSDTGSDVRGGPGFFGDPRRFLLLDGDGPAPGGGRALAAGAGADLGDADLDGDSDRYGTGERCAAGRDAEPPADRLLHDERGREIDGEDLAVDAQATVPEDDDADLDTTLEEGEPGDVADLDTTLGERRGDPRDVERGRATPR